MNKTLKQIAKQLIHTTIQTTKQTIHYIQQEINTPTKTTKTQHCKNCNTPISAQYQYCYQCHKNHKAKRKH